jgi:predicted nucleic acid-binding protein
MTVRYLIDTDWVIDHLNQIDRVVNRLKELRPQGLAISVISLAELYEGIHYSRHPEQSQQALEAFLEDVSVLGIDEEICKIFGRERARALEQDTQQIIPWVFPHLSGRHRGQRIQDFKKAWKTACQKAGYPGMLRHDFRRTAVRNMERAGVARSVATKVTGHRSESVYRRYAIVNDAIFRGLSGS